MKTAMDIRETVRGEILDYQQVSGLLAEYSKPRDRIQRLLREGSLIRIRKGLYVFGDRYRRMPLSRETLANLVYGPSYISLDYALSRYGVIPERIENVTSMTTGEKRRFSTPFGVFSYHPLPARRYAPGVEWAGEGDERYLIASPEKALIDKVWTDKRFYPAKPADFDEYFFDDLRADPDGMASLDSLRMENLARDFASRKITMLARWLRLHGGKTL